MAKYDCEITLLNSQKDSNDMSSPADNFGIGTWVTPGDVITTQSGFMRGHGTYSEDGKLHASVAGIVQRVNKLVSVKPVKSRFFGDVDEILGVAVNDPIATVFTPPERGDFKFCYVKISNNFTHRKYTGQVGDVVIGRVLSVGQKRWKVETNSRLDSILLLSAVNLPGGELRRRSEEDERMMRSYLSEGDLISAEVQQVFLDGALSLHTRSLRYGKLGQGTMVAVSPSLVKRRKNHFHTLPCGARLIVGNNGFIFIGPLEEEQSGGFVQNLAAVDKVDREAIARLRNCILALADHCMMLYDTSILYAYEASSDYQVKELLRKEVAAEIAQHAQQRLEMET